MGREGLTVEMLQITSSMTLDKGMGGGLRMETRFVTSR